MNIVSNILGRTMRINNYRANANTYAKHNKDEGTISLAFREFGSLFEKYVTSWGNKALDFGSGAGRSRMYLQSIGFESDGVDIDEDMILKAKELDKENSHKYQMITHSIVPHRASKYDLVFSSFVVLEMGNKEEIIQYFSEAYRVMKFDGTFLILTVNDNFYKHQWMSINTNYPGNMEAKSGDKVRVKINEINLELDDFYWTKQDVRNIASRVGFSILEEIEPLASKNEHSKWISECDNSPYVIFVLKKTKSLESKTEISTRLGLTINVPTRGIFKETYRDPRIIIKNQLPPDFSGDRNLKASIKLLMTPGDFWPFHKLKGKEIFKHIEGNDLVIHCIGSNGGYSKVFLGEENDNAVKEYTIPEDCWYAEEVIGFGGFSIIEATTSPGFHEDDLLEANKTDLLKIVKDDVEAIEVINRLFPTSLTPRESNHRFHKTNDAPSPPSKETNFITSRL